MKTQRHAARARVAAAGVVAGVLLAGCGAANESAPAGGSAPSAGGTALSGTISGAGASSQQAAMQAWIAGFTGANPDATVNYDPAGSGAGRTQFLSGGVAFAGSDAYLKADELTKAQQRCAGDVVEVPAYVSPIAVVYNLQGVTDLQLAPATVAGIFSGKITNWNAPEIAADNPGKTLPDQAITPVHRSDESGTTQNFTDYLNKASGGAWTEAASGTWPIQGGEAAQGTSGVIGAVQGGNGTIGYADESQAGSLGKALIKVGDAFTGPTPEAAANVLAESKRVEGRGNSSFAFDLARDTAAAGTYPIVLVSYQIACSKYADAAQADLVKGFLTYTTSADGQQAAAQAAGSAPLSDELRTQITPAVTGITAGA
ncbi:MAG TPA: phosphate ABC transporter substrate-binding protein PstS [Pseudonocardia sp.]|nr:phosphate ABC transporter substrate-binding protein PstS [Pseudonocardia sp.]